MNVKTALVLTVLVLLVAPDFALAGGCGSCSSHGAKEAALKRCPVTGEAGPACPVTGKKATPAAKHGATDIRLDPAEPTISTAGLVALWKARVPFTLLDARSGKWDDGSRLPKARALAADAPEQTIRRMLRNRNRLIVTYCASLTCPASAALTKRLKSLGYTNVIEYPYGIEGWKEMGLPVHQVSAGS